MNECSFQPEYTATIFSAGLLALRLQPRIAPCSVPTINLQEDEHDELDGLSHGDVRTTAIDIRRRGISLTWSEW